jgi:predicted small secreted protein
MVRREVGGIGIAIGVERSAFADLIDEIAGYIALLTAIGLPGRETMEGFGRDLQNLGDS